MTAICPLCLREVEIQHTPAIDKITGNRAHDYCLRIETPEHLRYRVRHPKYSVASELDADRWDAEYSRPRHVEPEDLE